jgi:hypothetical protein
MGLVFVVARDTCIPKSVKDVRISWEETPQEEHPKTGKRAHDCLF